MKTQTKPDMVLPALRRFTSQFGMYRRQVWLLVVLAWLIPAFAAWTATLTAFNNSVWPRSDVSMGVDGFVLEDFEDTTLAPGLKIRVQSPFLGGYGPVSALPFTYNGSQDQVGGVGGYFGSNQMWDGSHGLVNRPFLPIANYANDGGWSDVYFLFEGGASSVGFSYGQAEFQIGISLDRGSGLTYFADTPASLAGSYRNGYIRIDAGPGEVIYGVKLGNASFDGFLCDHVAFSPSDWGFSIIAAVSAQTAIFYGGMPNVTAMISNQIATVNQRFNNPVGPGFNAKFNFHVVTNYEFAGDPVDEFQKPHPGFDYMIVYDGFPTQGGGWYGEDYHTGKNYQTIHHSWSVTNSGGPFGAKATDGLVHEFGHARGAIDLYALNGETNSVNGRKFQAVRSIMNETYNVRMWDQHSRHLINQNGGKKAPAINYITDAFPPSIGIRVPDLLGVPLPNVQVRLFPVPWYSKTVGTASINGVTDASGKFTLFANPFGPGMSGAPWDIQFPNFLVTAKYAYGPTTSAWMPLYEVQNFHFNSRGVNYILDLTIPISTTGRPLITDFSLSNSSFGFTMIGSNSQNIVVEALTNYADLNPSNWFPVFTNTLDGGSSYFNDSTWSNSPMRFYRLRSP